MMIFFHLNCINEFLRFMSRRLPNSGANLKRVSFTTSKQGSPLHPKSLKLERSQLTHFSGSDESSRLNYCGIAWAKWATQYSLHFETVAPMNFILHKFWDCILMIPQPKGTTNMNESVNMIIDCSYQQVLRFPFWIFRCLQQCLFYRTEVIRTKEGKMNNFEAFQAPHNQPTARRSIGTSLHRWDMKRHTLTSSLLDISMPASPPPPDI